MNETQKIPAVQWRQVHSVKSINKFQAQFDISTTGENFFDCDTNYGTMPNGAWGRTEIYSIHGAPKMMIKQANDRSYGRIFIAD